MGSVAAPAQPGEDSQGERERASQISWYARGSLLRVDTFTGGLTSVPHITLARMTHATHSTSCTAQRYTDGGSPAAQQQGSRQARE